MGVSLTTTCTAPQGLTLLLAYSDFHDVGEDRWEMGCYTLTVRYGLKMKEVLAEVCSSADFIVAIFSNQKKNHKVEDFAWTGLSDSVALEHALSCSPSPPTLSRSLSLALMRSLAHLNVRAIIADVYNSNESSYLLQAALCRGLVMGMIFQSQGRTLSFSGARWTKRR